MIDIFSSRQASEGWLYYFKKQFNLVDRHIDTVASIRPIEEENKRDGLIESFRNEKIPMIVSYSREKVCKYIHILNILIAIQTRTWN